MTASVGLVSGLLAFGVYHAFLVHDDGGVGHRVVQISLSVALLATLVFTLFSARIQFLLSSKSAQLDLILRELPEAALSCDVDGVIVRFNRFSEELFGYRREDVIGKRLSLLIPDSLKAVHDQNVRDFFSSEGRVRMAPTRVFPARHASGRLIDVEIGLSATRGPLGKECIVLLRDVEERRALQRELAYGQRSRAVGQLSAGVAHEFNNIMQVIAGASQLLAIEDPKNEALTSSIDEAVDRGASLTRRLAAYAQVDVQKPTAECPKAVLEEAVLSLQRLRDEKAVSVTTDSAGSEWLVYADADRLQASLVQLLQNALQASAPGQEAVVRVQGEPLDHSDIAAGKRYPSKCSGWLSFFVEDQGDGISRDDLEKVCDPFFTTRDVGEGPGLGLSMVKGFARQSGGELEITSEVGQGTIARLTLPACAHDGDPGVKA